MIIIAIAFLFGVVTTVYLSLRSPEVKVPDIVGKNRFDAEKILADADLNFRVRAIRPSNQAKNTVLFQLPRPGEVVKAGQTVAMDISREAKEGEASETVKPAEEANSNSNSNSNSSGNNNENKPKKPKNKNANENANGNSNTNRNANNNKANANTNRGNSNRPTTNTGNTNTTPRANSNSNSNSRPGNTNQNVNRRPATPRPTPTPNR